MGLNLDEGISVVVPTYKGERFIRTLLNSLKEQTLDYDLFEVIFIVNGELDETPNIIKDFQSKNPEMNIILTSSEKGASEAHNKGISVASREYLAFVDDDDFISPNYLKRFFEHAKPNRIVVGYFQDIEEGSGKLNDSYITEPLPEESGLIKNPYIPMFGALTVVHDKLIPTVAVKDTLFDVNLINGDDVVYSSTLYTKNDFEFYFLSKDEDAIYYRLLRAGSLSRPELSYTFNITQRLKTINELFKIFPKAKTPHVRDFIAMSIVSQTIVFMKPYIDKHPEDLKKIYNEIDSYNFEYFPFWCFDEDINFNKSTNSLVISNAFPPTIDTSANVVTKRILTNRKYVDVISGTHYKREGRDFSLANVVRGFIRDKMEIEVNNAYFHFDGIKFVREGLEALNEKPTYENVYSRAQWVPSHLLGFFYKISHNTHWTAEFSDPIIYDLDGNLMTPPIKDESFVNEVNMALPKEFANVKVTDTVNEVAEYITFIMADELVFTNENQMNVMVEDFPELREMVLAKSRIGKHPTLDEFYYHIQVPEYEIDEDYVNFAYFGTLYGSRSFEEFVAGFSNLNDEFKDKFRLHVFTPNTEMFKHVLPPELLEKTEINTSAEYFDFINLTTKMDVLLVEDAITKHVYDLNPYLPSKISDYLGSGGDIWAICDKGSIMDEMDEIKYKSYLNNLNSSKKIINQIMADKLKVNVEVDDLTPEELIEYYQKRHLHLINSIMDLNNEVTCTEIQQQLQQYKDKVNYIRKFMRPRFVFKLIKKVRNYFRKLKSLKAKETN